MIDITSHNTSSPPAPGALELLQRFVNLHEHDEEGRTADPPQEMIRAFLVARGLLTEGERFTAADRETYLRLRGAIRRLVDAEPDDPIPAEDAEVIDHIGLAAGLHPHFHAAGSPTLEPKGAGVAAAFGAIVAIAFVASFDGTFEQLKSCADETCRAVFYDKSKNHSGRWCSMSTCGNRAKVRAWRERQRVGE
jgi:predicted RNA-binding Zn ribbon-like protein